MSEALPAKAERRWENPETIVKIATELSSLDHSSEVTIGGGDEANIDGDCSSPAKPFDLLFLQSTQKLGLQFQRKIPNLVQEQRAHMSQFQSSDPLRDRAGEGALFMPEELAFQQSKGNCRAIQLDETSDHGAD